MNPILERLGDFGCLLQVALDFTKLEDALAVAAALPRGEQPLIVEAGTPLIKAEGMRSASILAVATGHPVLADTKTFDAGALEAETAALNSASALTVIAVASNATIEATVSEAHRRGLLVVADLMGLESDRERLLERVEELKMLGVDGVELHVGVDVQRRLGLTAEKLADLIAEVADRIGFVAVAGGLKPESIPRVVEAGAKVVVVGGYITRSADPGAAARECLEALRRACRR